MKLHELHSAEGSRRNRKRVGRGTSSGYGKLQAVVKRVN